MRSEASQAPTVRRREARRRSPPRPRRDRRRLRPAAGRRRVRRRRSSPSRATSAAARSPTRRARRASRRRRLGRCCAAPPQRRARPPRARSTSTASPRERRRSALHGGDRIWFDRHTPAPRRPRSSAPSPSPSSTAPAAGACPSRVECAEPRSAPCRAVIQGLRDVGVVAGIAAPGRRDRRRTRCASSSAAGPSLRTDSAADQLERGPGDSGVYARPSADGRSIAALDPRGRTARTLGAGTGLVAATAASASSPTWIVTGTDDAGVAAAARAFRAGRAPSSDRARARRQRRPRRSPSRGPRPDRGLGSPPA